jgi:hypothetical protein
VDPHVHVADTAPRTVDAVALGFRPHTGWAAMVAVGVEASGIEVLDRRRAVLLDESLPRQVFHAAAALPPEEAEDTVSKVRNDACDAAVAVLEEATRSFGDLLGIAVVAWHPSVPEALERILSSHQLMHAAEGDLYRSALHDAAAILGLPVFDFLPADLPAVAATTLGLTPELVDEELVMLGKRLGPPWQRDQKDATLAAWAALRRLGAAKPQHVSGLHLEK